MTMLYQEIASLNAAIANCRRSGNIEWKHRHEMKLAKLIKDFMPSGAGFDAGTALSIESLPNKLIFWTKFHHMNDNGTYIKWTSHRVVVKPDLLHGISLKVIGPEFQGIKDYIAEVFYDHLRRDDVWSTVEELALAHVEGQDNA